MFGSGYNENAALMPELFEEYQHEEQEEIARLQKIHQLRMEFQLEKKKKENKNK